MIAVIRFPGSNCDDDARHVLADVLGADVRLVWHRETELDVNALDAVVLPGGFSYGDHLRSGAVAALSPVMREVARFAARGGPVLGICNGFQILTEAGLLPGGLLRNPSLHFVCKPVYLRVEKTDTPFTNQYAKEQVLGMPVAHNEGRYYADAETLARLEGENKIAFRYCNAQGEVNEESSPNASFHNIAGIVSERGNVLGMMPHPERASEELLGSADGLPLFRSLLGGATKGVFT